MARLKVWLQCHPNYRRAALQRISPRWLAFLNFLAQMNLVWSFRYVACVSRSFPKR
jgi:hypothetical protein